MENKKKIFTGEVFDIEHKETLSGKNLCKFRVRTEDGKLYPCILWEEQARKFGDDVRDNDKVYFEGYDKEGEITVKYFKTGKVASGSKVPTITAEEAKKYYENKRAKGFELVLSYPEKKPFFKLRKECVLVDSKWEGKLEFSLRVLGGEYVNRSLKEFGSANGMSAVKLLNKANPVAFNDVLNDLVGYAASEIGAVIQSEMPVMQGTGEPAKFDDEMNKI